MGFPSGYKVCHQSANKINDMGAPTYIRTGRLQTQMTSGKGTRDTTQEPQDSGNSIVILSSIQSGYSQETGKFCDLDAGFYHDEETSLLATGVNDWLKQEIGQLAHFDKMYNFQSQSFKKVINQKVTTPSPAYDTFTTAITTTRKPLYNYGSNATVTDPSNYVDIIEFDEFDYFDPDREEEVKKLIPGYPEPPVKYWPPSLACSITPQQIFWIFFLIHLLT
jgi:hypothetical protein